jgi:hypothetical protein
MGWFGLVAAIITFIWNGFLFAVLCAPQYSDSLIDKDSSLFNYAIVVMGGVTIIALVEWWRKSKNDWFQHLKPTDWESETDASVERDGQSGAKTEAAAV